MKQNLISFIDRPKVQAKTLDGAAILSCTRIAGLHAQPIQWIIEVTIHGRLVEHPALPSKDDSGPIRYTTRELNFRAESIGFVEWWSTWNPKPVRRPI